MIDEFMVTGYAALKRWTRKIDIFAHDLILIPVHLGMHWCLAVVNFKVGILTLLDFDLNHIIIIVN